MVTEGPDSFLFEFYILCRSYNYFNDAHELKLFLSTLKYDALGWFMGLEDGSIKFWNDMKKTFLRSTKNTAKLKTQGKKFLRWYNKRMGVWKTMLKYYLMTYRVQTTYFESLYNYYYLF